MITLILLTIIATKTWTSDIPWQCVQVDHCSNTICPGRTVRGVGCEENPFYSLTNFISNETGAYTTYSGLFASGYYNVPEALVGGLNTAPGTLIDYSGNLSKHTQE